MATTVLQSRSSSSPSPILVPEMHLGSLQDLTLTDFTARTTPPAALRSPPPRADDSPGRQSESPSQQSPAGGPDAINPSPSSAFASQQLQREGSGHQRYPSLPPGAAPPAPGGSPVLYPSPQSQPQPLQHPQQPHQQHTQQTQRPSSSYDTQQQTQTVLPLPTPPSSHVGPRHPSAAQQAGQMAGTPNPTVPRRAAVQPAQMPNIVTPLPMSLQGLIASEQHQQQSSVLMVAPPPVQNTPQPAPQRKKPDEEVCIECMMRDRDMADVDVTTPGAWARASDVEFEELLRRELEEEAAALDSRSNERLSIAGGSSSSGHNARRPRARGGRLTEENVRKWLLMNPKDHEARWRTITRYVKAQSILLEQEMRARERTESEARVAADAARDRYAAIRQSTGSEPFVVEPNTGMRGVRVPSTPTSGTLPGGPAAGYFDAQPYADPDSQSIPASPGRLLGRARSGASGPGVQEERDVVLLENGLMLERVDLRRESLSINSGRQRSASLDKRIGGGPHNGAMLDDRLSTYSTPLRYPSPPIPETASTRTGGSRPIPRAQSQMSSDRRSLFGGLRSSLAGSMISLAASRASVVNLHGQNWEHERMPSRAMSPSMPTLGTSIRNNWPDAESMPNTPQTAIMVPSSSVGSAGGGKKKKRGALGKIFKVFTGGKDKSKSSGSATERPSWDASGGVNGNGPIIVHPHQTQEVDINAPLAPPPPLTYLMSRKSGEHQRQQSATSLHMNGNANGNGTGVSPPTAPSSVLPSPSSQRFSWRQSNASLDILPSMQTSQQLYGQQQQHHAQHAPSFKDSGVDFPPTTRESKHLDVLPESLNDDTVRMRPRNESVGARPQTMFMTDKNLPPLPPEASSSSQRPGTAPGFRSFGTGAGDLSTVRRSSFSTPTQTQSMMAVSASSPNMGMGMGGGQGMANGYASHARSATNLDDPQGTAKRRSKFGNLTSMFGVGKRKSAMQLRADFANGAAGGAIGEEQQFVAYRYPGGEQPQQAPYEYVQYGQGQGQGQGQQQGYVGQVQYGQASTLPVGSRR